MTPLVRPAAPRDAQPIARIRIDAWRATYAGVVPAAILDGMDLDRNETFFAGIIDGPGTHEIVVVEDPPGTVAGYAMVGPARDEDAAGLGELDAIYLAPDRRGQGLGAPLLATALEALRGRGFQTVVLWVLTSNEAARRFYERQGFTLDGARRDLDFNGTPIEEIRYRRTGRGPAA